MKLGLQLVPLAAALLLMDVAGVAVAQTAEWSPTGSMGTARCCHAAVRLLSGEVLVVGGSDASGVTASAERYDPVTGTWREVGRMAYRRGAHEAVLLPSGEVLVVGGGGDIPSSRTAELYDPVTNTWRETGRMVHPRELHTAVLLRSGKVLVTGGWPTTGSAELYDPDSGTWRETGRMAQERLEHMAVLLPSGAVLVAGGQDHSARSLSSAEVYDPVTELWTSAGEMPRTRYRAAMVSLPSGQVLVLGGQTSTAYKPVDILDLAQRQWRELGSLARARLLPSAELLPSGQVLVVGWDYEHSNPSAGELFDPASGTSRLTGSEGLVRISPSVTLLHSGRVLVAGGTTSPHGSLSTAVLSPDHGRTPPVARPVQRTTVEDGPVEVVLEGSDEDRDALTYDILSGPAHGTLSGSPPALAYTPEKDFNGSDAFIYAVGDGIQSSSPVIARLIVTPLPDPPSALPVSVTTPEGTPVTVRLEGSDPDGDKLTYEVLSQPRYGRLSGSGPELTYTPPPAGFGQESFAFRVSDGMSHSDPATVSLIVTPGRARASCSAAGEGRGASWVLALVLLMAGKRGRRR